MRLLVALALATGCYRPADLSCTQTCDVANNNSDCPNGLTCNSDGMCSAGGATCGLDAGGDPTDSMTEVDAPPDVPPGTLCLGTAPMEICFPSGEPTAPLTLSSIDTSTECPRNETHDGQDVCIVAATIITINGTVRPTGSRPLVLVGTQRIDINPGAVLDLSSSSTILPRVAAGSQPMQCQNSSTGAQGQDGAGGGSFASRGGEGGIGTGGMMGGEPGNAVMAPIRFRGGCAGAASPSNDLGGPGGGAVYLIAPAIQLDGRIGAGGGGGSGGGVSAGGAGGGSGGYIGIDSPTVSFGTNSGIFAPGGSGGGGGCMGAPGTSGGNADHAVPAPPAGNGADLNPSGNGGTGSFTKGSDAMAGVASQGVQCAGGGGGGGVGAIRFFQGNPCPASRCIPDDQ